MCSIVATAVHTPSHSPRTPNFPVGSKAPEVMWRDDNFTIYRERANPVSSKGHLIVVFNLHVPSLYTLSATDLPLLVSIRDLSRRLLTSLLPLPSASVPPSPTTPFPSMTPTPNATAEFLPTQQSGSVPSDNESFRIGFITPPFKDSKIPVTDHLHAHAYILPADLMGWWRAVGFSPMAWYNIDDLIAEIREESTNNRVRSGNPDQKRPRPIDTVPGAGARTGTANGIETTASGLAAEDIEDPESNPHRRSRQSTSSSAHLSVGVPSRSPSPSQGPVRRASSSNTLVEAGGPSAPFTGGGGALVMSPRTVSDDALRTPTGRTAQQSTLLTPTTPVPQLQVSQADP
ncbi:hypothetical protein EIP91_002402 [Steccherinum ochraceum]|uniref:Uncharacterized protein n=1 Tax=Steccherinum ochraceum TaxID=92696 RepID=A0A4R0S0T5_9APHY|nr:hypothetical protein EIP91_002402 [Steccherinum ochraceum]